MSNNGEIYKLFPCFLLKLHQVPCRLSAIIDNFADFMLLDYCYLAMGDKIKQTLSETKSTNLNFINKIFVY